MLKALFRQKTYGYEFFSGGTMLIYNKNKVDKKLIDDLANNFHISVGKILGFCCPMDIEGVTYNYKVFIYDIFVQTGTDSIPFYTEMCLKQDADDCIKEKVKSFDAVVKKIDLDFSVYYKVREEEPEKNIPIFISDLLKSKEIAISEEDEQKIWNYFKNDGIDLSDDQLRDPILLNLLVPIAKYNPLNPKLTTMEEMDKNGEKIIAFYTNLIKRFNMKL